MEKLPQDSESRHADKYIVRFPDGMRDRLKEAAHANGRSMNAEIIARIQLTFDQDPALGFMTPNQRKAILGSPELEERLVERLSEKLKAAVKEAWSAEQINRFANWQAEEQGKKAKPPKP